MYHTDWLYISDAQGCATEIINGARLANNLLNSNLCGYRYGNVLTNAGCDGLLYAPGVPAALQDAVFWIDAADGQPNDQYARNRGSGGPILNAILGAATAVGTDEPLLLNGVDHYVYTPSVSGNNASAPDTAVLRCTTDFEIICRVAMDDWTPAATQSLVSKFTAGSQGYELFLNTAGTLALIMRIAAADVTATSTVAPTVADGQGLWLRVTRVSSTGVVSFYTAPDEDNVPSTNWSLLGATVTSTTGAVTAGSTGFFMGERANNTQSAALKLFRVIVRNVVAANVPSNDADFDFTRNTSQSSFVATVGGTVTLNRSTSGRKTVSYQGRPLWLFGTDDYMSVPDNDLLDFTNADSMTVIAVHRTHNVAIASTYGLVGKLPATVGWQLINDTGAATSTFTFRDGAVTSQATSGAKVASGLSVVTGVRNRTARTVQAYLNGSATVAVVDNETATSANSSALFIGALAAASSNLDGELVSVMIWRRALTASEISAISTFYATSLGPTDRGNYIAVDLTAQTSNPWYNASSLASQEAFGFIIEEWTGLDGAHQNRASYATGQRQGGAFFGQQTQSQRVMKLNVLLHGSSERGLNYLFRWLESTLLNSCAPSCGQRQMWLRQFCPSAPASDPTEGVMRAERVVLIEGLQWESPPMDDAACFLRRASFTLAAGDPCLYREPVQLTPPSRSTIAGVTITPTATTSLQANCATWAGTNRRTQIDVPQPEYGSAAPVITITSPMANYTVSSVTTRATLPILRISGYSDPYGYGDPCRAMKIGEMVLEGVQMAGLTIYVDLAQRRVTYDDPYAGIYGQDGSGFIGSQIVSGINRWWTFDGCTSGFVVVEPAYATLDTVRSVGVTSGLRLASEWTTTISYASRCGCA